MSDGDLSRKDFWRILAIVWGAVVLHQSVDKVWADRSPPSIVVREDAGARRVDPSWSRPTATPEIDRFMFVTNQLTEICTELEMGLPQGAMAVDVARAARELASLQDLDCLPEVRARVEDVRKQIRLVLDGWDQAPAFRPKPIDSEADLRLHALADVVNEPSRRHEDFRKAMQDGFQAIVGWCDTWIEEKCGE